MHLFNSFRGRVSLSLPSCSLEQSVSSVKSVVKAFSKTKNSKCIPFMLEVSRAFWPADIVLEFVSLAARGIHESAVPPCGSRDRRTWLGHDRPRQCPVA